MPKDATNKTPAKKATKKAATRQAAPAGSAKPAKTAAKKSAVNLSASAAEVTPQPTDQQIAARAHQLWQQRGGHHGDHVNDWLQAEEQLKAGK